MSVPTNEPGPISAIRPGMDVVDAAGEKVGTVEDVRMGDPGAETAGAEEPGAQGLVGFLGAALTVDDGLADTDRERLLRLGYVRIDAAGLFSGSRFAASDEIATVDDDVVRLSVPAGRLVG